MPNHVTHRVMFKSVDKNDMEKFIEQFFTEDDDNDLYLDFQKIIPMPEILRDSESSSSVSYGLAVLGRFDVPVYFGRANSLSDMLSFPWVVGEDIKTEDELREVLLKRDPDCVEKAKLAIKAFEETGHTSWYSWSIDNWGTKWNSYSNTINRVSDTELELTFDTAWSCPTPVLSKLAELSPEISFIGSCFDEGWNFAGTFMGGEGFFNYTEVEATPEIYEVVYGEFYEGDEEYEDEDEIEPVEN